MVAEPPSFRNARGWTQVSSDQKLPVSGRECRSVLEVVRTRRRLVQEFQTSEYLEDARKRITELKIEVDTKGQGG